LIYLSIAAATAAAAAS